MHINQYDRNLNFVKSYQRFFDIKEKKMNLTTQKIIEMENKKKKIKKEIPK